MLEIIKGNLLEAKEQYICHQANCVSKGAGGLAYHLFNKYPYSNVYLKREIPNTHKTIPDVPGTIKICGDGIDQRYVINMFGQYFPGAPGTYSSIYEVEYLPDSLEDRETYFQMCLDEISNINHFKGLVFPDHIGCGLGGGVWKNYLKMIEKFSNNSPDVDVKIYKL